MSANSSLDFKFKNTFESYFIEYQTIPNYKKMLNAMIKFEDMYTDLFIKPRYIDSPQIHEENIAKRAQIYMNKKDIVKTYDATEGKKLVVTSRGHKIFYKDYPLAQLRNKPWNGMWTTVIYDFPEEHRVLRNYIRRNLQNLGFGAPQRSVLISPLSLEVPIQKLIEAENLSKQVWVLKGKRILGTDNREVAQEAWPIIKELNQLYKELLRVLPIIKKNRDKEKKLTWKQYFLGVNNADPYLPKELLPEKWYGTDCEKEYIKICKPGIFTHIFTKKHF